MGQPPSTPDLQLLKDPTENAEAVPETDRQTDTHHLKVLVSDATEGLADVTAGEPLIGSQLALLPGRQAAQSF